MKRRTKRVIAIAVAAASVLILGGVGAANYLSIALSGEDLFGEKHEIRGARRAEAIECLLDWARAAPLPASAQAISVTTGGSMFTRSFRVTFTAPAADIEGWLLRSPGVQDAVVTVPRPGVRHYQINPSGGASFAEITVDDTQQRVVIDGYWS